MPLRQRVILTVFLMTGAAVAASTFSTFWFGSRVLEAHTREQLRREGITRLNQLESTVSDAETGQRGFVITGEEAYLQPFNQASEQLPADLEDFRNFTWIDISPDEIGRVAQLIELKVAELRSTIELRRRAGFDATVPIIRSGSGKKLMDNLRGEMTQLQERQVAGLKADGALSDRITRTRTLVFVFCGILNIVVLAWGYRRITEALKQRDVALRNASMRGFEVQQQKDLLSVTLSSIGDCVIVTDNEGRITFMNPVAEQVTGWKLNEAMGRPTSEVFRILNEDTRGPLENPVDKVMRDGVIVGLANHSLLVRKDGAEIPIDDSGAPIRGESGGIRGVVLVFRDFSQHRQAEQELRIARDAAEKANKAKDQFLAMLSHELRTPLTPVLATLNLWEASEEVPQSLRSDVEMLRRSIELEARIIDDLLDLTRIARGMLAFSPENTDVHSVLEFLVGLSQSEFQNKELKITLKLNAPRHYVHTDAARLQQVFWNILRNSIKFTEQGGTVTIATSNDGQDGIVTTVSDTGIGMTAETLSKLFVPFEQADPTRNRRYGGLGLGMTISNALVELLEGELNAESPGLGRGSTFTVRFPATDSATKSSDPDRAPRTWREKVCLLLVEDHVDTARALSRLLESRGYKVEIVATVATALEAVERTAFDLLLCDLGLPDGTGIDLIEKVRKDRKTPAIALTGFGMQEDVERAERAGFDAHLTKPVNLQKLEATIWRLLQDPGRAGSHGSSDA
jgi:PAS domain S-box-containing protein